MCLIISPEHVKYSLSFLLPNADILVIVYACSYPLVGKEQGKSPALLVPKSAKVTAAELVARIVCEKG